MRSIKARFENIKKKYPMKGDVIIFNEAVKGQGFTKRSIGFWFVKLTDKEDWGDCKKENLVNQAFNLSNNLER